MCSGPRCSLPGSIAPGTHGKGPWFCWWHFSAFIASQSLYDVTERIERGETDTNARPGSIWADENRSKVKPKGGKDGN